LGRPRGTSGIERLEGLLEEMTFVGERHSLEEVALVDCRRSSAGATYTAVARFPKEGA
jgi:hypothetical protein